MTVQRFGFHAQSTFLVINFNGSLDGTFAQEVANYRIVGPGGHRIKVSSAVYDAATNTVTLKPSKRLNVHRTYRLTINGTTSGALQNPAGVLMAGSAVGQPGTNYVTKITWRNLAGRASQRPNVSMVRTDHTRPAGKAQAETQHDKTNVRKAAVAHVAQTPSHLVQPLIHKAAVDHLLATTELFVPKSRAKR